MRNGSDNNNEVRQVVDFDELYPGRFIKAGTLKGGKPTLTISHVHVEKLEGDSGKKWKGVVSFHKTEMQLVLNKTNGECLKAMFGREVPKWIGRKVTLFPSEWNGEPCIRVWGSPELDRDKTITIALPKRKPITMVMHAVRANGQGQGQRTEERRREPERPPTDVDEITRGDDGSDEPQHQHDEHYERHPDDPF